MDRISVLRHARNLMAKTWRADGSIKPYDDAKFFQLEEHQLAGISDLSVLLTELEREPHACVIRGRYVGDTLASQRDPAEFRPGAVRRSLDYFADQALHAVLIDVDGYEPLTCDPVMDPAGAIEEFVACSLPAEFRGASYHWQLSNSAGHPSSSGRLKAHLWFWLREAYTSAQLKAWAQALALPVDLAVFNPVQVHYTAAPMFEFGVKDPVRTRSGYVAGLVDTAVPLEIDLAQLAAAPQAAGRGERLRELVSTDPIAQRLLELGLVKTQRRDGGLNIECPFTSEHTGASGETSTTYFPPHTGGFEDGNFKCLHAHCMDRPRRGFLLKLAEDPSGIPQPEILQLLEGDLLDDIRPIETATPVTPSPAAAERSASRAEALPAVPDPFPGVMAATVEAALGAAPKPQPELAVFAVLAGMAAGLPGHYRTAGGLRPNLYVCGVAPTGAGKELPRNVAVALAKACDTPVIGRPASGEAVEDQLKPRGAILCEVDEAAHMLAAVNGSKAPAYLIALASNMLKLFSASAGSFNTRARAIVRGVFPPRSVPHPCFNFLGFTTPEKLGESVTFANISDGLLGRMLFVFGRDGVKPRRAPAAFELPQEVVSAADAVRHAVAMAGAMDAEPDDIVVQEGLGTAQVFEELLASLDARAAHGESAFARALLVRSFEKVERIAAVLAIWEMPAAPVIRPDHVQWAHRTVLASDAALLTFAEQYMHDGQVQADASRVIEILRKVLSGGLKPDTPAEAEMLAKGMAASSLVLRRSKLEARRFNEAVSHLVQTAQVVQGVDGDKARKVRVMQLGAV